MEIRNITEMGTEMKNYYAYWGKANDLNEYHLLVYHSLDVAAVSHIWMEQESHYFERFANALHLTPQAFKEWFSFFIAIHDVGKFSTRFQSLKPELLKKLQGKTNTLEYNTRHDALGRHLFDLWLKDEITRNTGMQQTGAVEKIFEILADIVLGHHGMPHLPEPRTMGALGILEHTKVSILQYLNELREMFLSDDSIGQLLAIEQIENRDRKKLLPALRGLSWQLAGIATVCDWIGSGQSFNFKQQEVGLTEYFAQSKKCAEQVLKISHIRRAAPATAGGMHHLFPTFTPTPLQHFCDTVEIHNGPSLWILEDVTGAGKTEAALTLASRIVAQGNAQGCFIGLPTMATSNAMYERMAHVYFRLFAEGERPTLTLGHGSRHLSQRFRESYADAYIQKEKNNITFDEANKEQLFCSQWIADSSKKALLADAGVGTLDQVLMAGLPIRYQSLRALGLTDKIFIVDEIHAYDPYMARQLENILETHANLGGSAILLSASLPQKLRESFCASFAKGLNIATPSLTGSDFPLVTSVSTGKSIESQVDTRPELKRKVAVSFCDSTEIIHDLIRNSLAASKCVCWIRNTIADVNTSYDALIEDDIVSSGMIEKFHSRFALKDRLNIEQRVLGRFGKDSGAAERTGRVLIASQVVEQSLDLDFDVLITDIAPIDYVIQRAGRLHRHLRDEWGNRVLEAADANRPAPVLYVHIPPEPDVPDVSWFKNTFPAASYVYKNIACLWRTKEILKQEQALVMPEKARTLMEAVYGDDAALKIPEVFEDAERKANAKRENDMSIADFNVLNFKKGYSAGSSRKWTEEDRTPTRLGEPQSVVYLARYDKGNLVPLYNDAGFSPWDMSSVKIRKTLIEGIRYPEDVAPIVDKLKKQSRFKFDAVICVFSGDDMITEGWSKQGDVLIRYDDDNGLSIEKVS